MSRKPAQLDATLQKKAATLARQIADRQKDLAENKRQRRILAKAAHDRECYLLGELVYAMGLGELPREELHDLLLDAKTRRESAMLRSASGTGASDSTYRGPGMAGVVTADVVLGTNGHP
jgi:Conjugal transfer protein TraD